MTDLEKDTIKGYITDMTEEDLKYLISQLDSKILFTELMERDQDKENKLNTIGGLFNVK